MAYSVVGIVNMGLSRIGVKRITALDEDSSQAIAANAIWEYIRDEVLETKDWRFAKTRIDLAQNAETPEYGYDYAYTLPVDFLRLCLPKKEDSSFYPSGAFATAWSADEITIRSRTYGYVIEALADGTKCIFTDYDDDGYPLYITYIRKEVNPAKYSPAFVNCLADRIAAELATPLTEGRQKFVDRMTLYESSLKKAEEINRSLDYVKGETGNDDWLRAGR